MDSAKKRRVKSAISWILSIGLVGAITGGALLSDARKPVDTGTRVVNGAVSMGTIEQTLRGGGKLADHYDFKMSLPSGVKLESYLVEEGQVVETDEAVAVVDQVSLNQTILSVYQAVSDITGEIETLLSEENLEEMTSSVTGEVKEIYVSEGSDIRTAMLEHGALALIALDEYHEVKVVGIEGVVQSVRVAAGDKVEAGDVLFRTSASGGSARLQLLLQKRAGYEETLQSLFQLLSSAPSKGMLYAVSSGRIGNLNEALLLNPATEDEQARSADLLSAAVPSKEAGWLGSVYMGAGYTGILYDDPPSDTTLPDPSLMALFTMLSTGNYTGYAGIVSQSGQSPAVMLNPTGIKLNDPSALASLGNLPADQAAALDSFTKAVQIPQDMPVMVLENGQVSQGKLTDAKEGDYLVLLQEEGKSAYALMLLVKLQTNTQPDGTEDSSSQNPQTPDQLVPDNLPALPEGLDLSQLTPEQLSQLSQLTPEQLSLLAQLLNPSGNGESTAPQTDENSTPDLSGLPEGFDASQLTPEQLLQLQTLMNAYGGTGEIPDLSGYAVPDLSAYAGMLSGLDFSGLEFPGTDMASEAAPQTYQIQDQPLLTITPLNWMQLDIQIDEQDVALITLGQPAEVIIEALKNTWDEESGSQAQSGEALDRIRTFEGIVRSISTKGTNGGGSSKYTVSIAVPYTEGMLAGMNASVKLMTSSWDNLLLVPIEAVEDAGGSLMVYTAYDQKTDTLLSPVPVEIGVSDASYVQITSGLEEGMSYYYREIVPEEESTQEP